MRDLLPAYVHGTLPAADRAVVAAHVKSCADCSAEAALIAAASRAYPAPGIDVGRIVNALPSAPQPSRRSASWGNAWRVAAAVGLVALGAYSVVAVRGRSGVASRQAASAPAGATSAPVAAPSPGAALAAADSPAHTRPPAAAPAARAQGMSFGGGLSDLTAEQLDALLGELDALDSLPSAEPESHLTPIEPTADGGHNAR